MKDRIQQLAEKYYPRAVEIRRHLHSYPELSFQEVETGKYIAHVLEGLNIRYSTGWAGNGLVAMINEDYPDERCIALRADIDALPILEQNDASYKSKNEGVMHACGHDVHTACLLGAIHILNEIGDDLPGKIKCIFQPGEERLPGGASIMIKEGVLQSPSPDYIFGQHVHPPLEVGKVGLKSGQYMASADEIYLKVVGRGGHAALPQDCIDTILLASRIIDALQAVVSRGSNPTTPSVLTLGKINSVGGATNVIPNQVLIEGTFRTMNEEWRFKAHQMIKDICHHTAATLGGSCEVDIKVGYPSLFNDEQLTGFTKQKMIDYLGEENVVDLPPRMTAEDFSYFSQNATACFYRLGTGNPSKGITSPVHTPTFDVDEASIKTGMGLMAYLAYQTLLERSNNML